MAAEPKKAWKSKLLFARELEKYLADLRQHILGNCVVHDEDLGVILSQKSNDNYIKVLYCFSMSVTCHGDRDFHYKLSRT